MNTRFAVAVHILALLQSQQGRPTSSEFIAGSVNTNPSLIRRLLTHLNRAGLTSAQMGTGGGATLARPAADITLRDVYRAVNDAGGIMPLHERPNPQCDIGRNIQAVLEARVAAATRALEDELAGTSIADLAGAIARRERRRA